jgi:tRNA(adenine34) deaminase
MKQADGSYDITYDLATDLMQLALGQARLARDSGEVPIGAVIWKAGQVIGRGYNQVERGRSVTRHAEMLALEAATQSLNNWRLLDTVMCVTCEPCLMCTGAILHAGVSVLIYGASQPNEGACVSVFDLTSGKNIRVISGVCEAESQQLLQHFFKNLR